MRYVDIIREAMNDPDTLKRYEVLVEDALTGEEYTLYATVFTLKESEEIVRSLNNQGFRTKVRVTL